MYLRAPADVNPAAVQLENMDGSGDVYREALTQGGDDDLPEIISRAGSLSIGVPQDTEVIGKGKGKVRLLLSPFVYAPLTVRFCRSSQTFSSP